MEHEQQLGNYRSGEYPSPVTVAAMALGMMQPDGSVAVLDEENNEMVIYQPCEEIPLDALPADVYASHLFYVARTITGTVLHIASCPERAEGWLRNLAHYLSAYRHDPAFVRHAASLITIDDRGFLHYPHLPPGSPWDWVPKLRSITS
jgi:hypothetical protein